MKYAEHLQSIRDFLESNEHWHSLENCQPSLDTHFCDYFNYDLSLGFSFGQSWDDGTVYLFQDRPVFDKYAEFSVTESSDIVKFLKNEQKLLEERDLRWVNGEF